MNRFLRSSFRIVGFLLFAFALVFNIVEMPDADDIRIKDNLCNAKVDIFGEEYEVGKFAQDVLNKEEDCRKVHLKRLGVDYSWIVMVLGVVLFFIGVWFGVNKKGRREILS